MVVVKRSRKHILRILTPMHNLEKYVSILIPLTISSELAGLKLTDAIVSGFGAGLSWGTAHISLAACICFWRWSPSETL